LWNIATVEVRKMARLRGKVALITGGARGQGRAIAQKFAAEGASIAICDVCAALPTMQYAGATIEELEETRHLVESLDRPCIASVVDVRDAAQLEQFVSVVLHEFGRIDILCANAGIAAWVPFAELTIEQWGEMLDVNVTGVFLSVKAVAPQMIENRDGCIIITSSVSGREPGKGLTHYVTSKHAVIGLMRNLALELGPYGIRVNAVLPSAINTTMGNNPVNSEWIFGRSDATEEDYLIATRNWHALRNLPAMPPQVVADAMIWLASDEGRNISGVDLPVDGGHLVLPGFNHDAVVETPSRIEAPTLDVLEAGNADRAVVDGSGVAVTGSSASAVE
jgi:SDR family mycofactocin-dependent oxidoreductase